MQVNIIKKIMLIVIGWAWALPGPPLDPPLRRSNLIPQVFWLTANIEIYIFNIRYTEFGFISDNNWSNIVIMLFIVCEATKKIIIFIILWII